MDELLDKLKVSSKLSVDEARKAVKDIENYICNNSAIVPPYFLKLAQDEVRQLEAFIHQPVGFKFKKKTDSPKKESEEKAPTKDDPSPSEVEPESSDAAPSFGFKSKSDETLILSNDQVDGKDISLVDLKKCSIEIKGCANSVYIKNLVSCEVKIGLASRAILMADCTDCQFVLICQQLRIDSSNDCTFELYISSRAMLENSKNLSFRCLRWTFDGMEELLKRVNFQADNNNWKQIDDFDWLSKDTKSKNFKLLE